MADHLTHTPNLYLSICVLINLFQSITMSNRSIIISHHHNTTTENIKKGWSPTTAQFVQENLPTVLDKSTSLFLYSKIENTFQLEILPCSPCKSHICWYFWTEKKNPHGANYRVSAQQRKRHLPYYEKIVWQSETSTLCQRCSLKKKQN